MKSLVIQQYEQACEKLVKAFISIYFEGDYLDDYYWVGDEIGGVLSISDYFLNVDLMIEALRLKVKPDLFFDFYWYDLNCAMVGTSRKYNLKNYIALNEAERKRLE